MPWEDAFNEAFGYLFMAGAIVAAYRLAFRVARDQAANRKPAWLVYGCAVLVCLGIGFAVSGAGGSSDNSPVENPLSHDPYMPDCRDIVTKVDAGELRESALEPCQERRTNRIIMRTFIVFALPALLGCYEGIRKATLSDRMCSSHLKEEAETK